MTATVLLRDLDWLATIARGYAAVTSPWRSTSRARWYERVLLTDAYEVWVIGWPPGSAVGLHDHDDAGAAICVVDGEIVEVRPERRGSAEWRLRGGQTVTVEPGVVHDVINRSDRAGDQRPRVLPTTVDDELLRRRHVRRVAVCGIRAGIRQGPRLRTPGVGRADDLRARNTARCERLIRRSAILDTSDLCWDDAAEVELDADAIAALVYMRDVEGFTDRDLVGLTAHPATTRDPVVAAFLEAWRAEEIEHARAIDRFLHAYGTARSVEVQPMQAPPPAIAPLSERLLVLATRPVGHVVTAAHMAWGAANELLTMRGYRLLAAKTASPLLQTLLGRIAAQEARHYSFYMLQAEWRLAASPLARAVLPRMLRRAWTPVGIGDGYKQPSEFQRVVRYLADGDAGRRAVAVMDTTFSSLPGFDGLHIYARAAA